MFGEGIFVPGQLETRTLIAEHRAVDYERNRRFEEMTDLAERIGFPIRTTIHYDLRGGSLYARTDRMSRAFIEQTYQAKAEAPYLFTGDQSFEVTRRSHEHDEAIMVEQLARGELDGNVLIKVSKVPDAVVENRTSIKGYKRKSLRTFVRVYRRDGSSVACTLFSIDSNNHEGLNRLGGLIDMPLTGRSSEDILADARLFDVPESEVFVDEFVTRSVSEYDEAIWQTTGKETYAGSPFLDQLDAQSAVESQPGLLREHFEAIAAISGMALNESAKVDLYEIERERTAAAISLAGRGYEIGSTSDSAVSAEVERGDYSRECATASENAMQQGENSELLKDWEKVVENCPKCGKDKVNATKKGEIISGDCGCHLNVCTGEYWQDSPTKTPTKLQELVTTAERSIKREREDKRVVRLYGESAIIKTRTVLGGATVQVIDGKTDQLLASASSKRKLFELAA